VISHHSRDDIAVAYLLILFKHPLSICLRHKRSHWRISELHYNVGSIMAVTDMVSIPITLEQLMIAVQQLPPDERAQLASVLIQSGLRSDLTALIQELYAQSPGDDITDDDIMAEIQVVRRQSQSV
jgi:hypothetical protein